MLLFLALAVLIFRSQAAAQPVPGTIHPDLNTLPTPPSRIPIYYPPAPPAPGAEIDPIPALLLPNWNAPPGLAEYVGELFYPVVGSRLAELELSRPQRTLIDEYINKRRDLVATLRRHLAGEAGLPADHATEVTCLAETGDQLRSELINDRFDWGAHRSWRVERAVSEKDELLVRVREFQLLRASVFYGEILSVDQRWLLWDYVLRIEESGTEQTSEHTSVRPGGLLRFLPEGSRIRLPLQIPRELLDELKMFVAAKESIQREIAETIIRLEPADISERKYVLSELGRRQQNEISDLEQRAEAIRVRIAALPPQPPLVLPKELSIRARAYRLNRDALQAELAAKLRAARSPILEYHAGSEYLMWEADSDSGVVVPLTSSAPGVHLAIVPVETDAQRERGARAQAHLESVLKAYMRESVERREALEKERQDLVDAALQLFVPGAAQKAPVPRDLLNRILALFAVDEIAERMDRYQSYFAATSLPGLTPGQRRLLFGEALRELSLPLTPGVRRPVNQMLSP